MTSYRHPDADCESLQALGQQQARENRLYPVRRTPRLRARIPSQTASWRNATPGHRSDHRSDYSRSSADSPSPNWQRSQDLCPHDQGHHLRALLDIARRSALLPCSVHFHQGLEADLRRLQPIHSLEDLVHCLLPLWPHLSYLHCARGIHTDHLLSSCRRDAESSK